MASPTQYLATVQVGVTLAGFMSAAFGAQALSKPVADWLVSLGMSHSAASTSAFLGVTLIITYVSLVFDELVPKRLAQLWDLRAHPCLRELRKLLWIALSAEQRFEHRPRRFGVGVRGDA